MRPLLATLLTVLATAASAQSGLQLELSGQDTEGVLRISPAACGTELPITWEVSTGATICSPLSVWVSTVDCGTAAGATDLVIASVPEGELTAGEGQVQLVVNQLAVFTAEGGEACGVAEVTASYRICGAFKTRTLFGECTQEVRVTSAPRLIYDAQPPAAPALTGLDGLDGALRANFTADTDATLVHLELRPEGVGAFALSESVAAALGGARLGGLENGVTYEVRAVVEDAVGNLSQPSGILTGTPVETHGFWDRYRDAGGAEQGGCRAVPGAPLAGLALLLWALRRSRA